MTPGRPTWPARTRWYMQRFVLRSRAIVLALAGLLYENGVNAAAGLYIDREVE